LARVRRNGGKTAMAYTLTEGHFSTEDEARSEIEARGWRAITIDLDAAESDLHWHDFDAVLYVLDGTVTITFDDGRVMQCGAGARVDTPAGIVHYDSTTAYSAVIGLAVAPDEMTRPINKTPESLEV